MKVPFLDLKPQHDALREEILAAFARVYDRRQFCLGAEVEAFEAEFAAAMGAGAAVGVSNGTTALQLAANALGIGPGDEVIVPAFSFIASAWTASHAGARPVFADIDPATFGLDPEAAARAVTPKTRAIVVVHLFGQPVEMAPLLDLAKRHDLRVIEDCAQAHGARWRGHPVGLVGDIGTFSFYPTKNLGGCGEGGAVVSRHGELLDRVRLARAHGSPERYRHTSIGYNHRMEGLQAAALRVKLPHLGRWTERRRVIADRYLEGIRLQDTLLPARKPEAESVWHQFTLRHPRRDALRAHLAETGIGTDLIYPVPLPHQPCYHDLGYNPGDFPVAEKAAARCLSLPIWPEMADEQVEAVVAAINAFAAVR
ncbi:MAG: DegT/DnrJ/EryC1/StrS family aminotransferase [Puniceicoccaceae bacterium]|nr:MAG: DegT/DnrJ/EryC1/StrS family aminotransferase [Puniceicoccaceae bacterium]